jgi:hypothetical protein
MGLTVYQLRIPTLITLTIPDKSPSAGPIGPFIARVVAGFIDGLFPMSPEGYHFDLYVSNADVNAWVIAL